MNAKRSCKVLVIATVALAVLAGAAGTASAQSGTAASPGPKSEQKQQGPKAEGAQEQTQAQIRVRLQERIRQAPDLAPGERAAMQANLEACLQAGATSASLQAIFHGEPKGKQISTQTMLRLQERVRAAAQEGLPVEPVLAKLQEARTKGVPEANLERICERMESHVREANRIVTQAKADGVKPAPDARRERRMIQELAQHMWRGTTAADVDQLRTRARERSRQRACTLEDLTVASETATRLREEGVDAGRAVRVTGDALAKGYGADELRRLQYMMVYRHRENRAVAGLVDDFEHCLGAGMDSAHMYQYMMQHGWMGPGDVQGPGGSRPIDDQGHGPGQPGGRDPGGRGPGDGGGTGNGTGGSSGGTGGGTGSGPGGTGTPGSGK